MAQGTDAAPKRLRISVDVNPEFRHRLRLAAAKRDVPVGRYVLEAIELRLQRDVGKDVGESGLTIADDPVLEELWDNPRDAEYDRL